jgi:hypothetical protein
MSEIPIHKRKFYAFLSHSHANKDSVDTIDRWLNDIARIPVWYDNRNLPAGIPIASYLAECILQCRAMILVISKESTKSGWVKEEYEQAIGQRTRFKDFRIIPIRIDDCELPGFIQTTKWIDLPGGKLTLRSAYELLSSLYFKDTFERLACTKDIYISRSWHESEAETADHICKALHEAGFRLIGDSKDQEGFKEGERVKSIVSSCGGMVAILPDRGQGKTSRYMLDEIEMARSLGLPYFIVSEKTVDLSEPLKDRAILFSKEDVGSPNFEARLNREIETLGDEWRAPGSPHYIFFGTAFDGPSRERNDMMQSVAEITTAMPIVMGENIREGEIQKTITSRITRAFAVIADISEENLNTCIEAGIARGAGVRLHLIAKGPRKRPPFMFRDLQVWYYSDDIDLLGIIHRLTYPYRRRVINYELL